MFERLKEKLLQIQQVATLGYLIKWLFLSLLVGLLAGAASAFFLKSLHWATDFRNEHMIIIFGLPLGGLVIGLMYHYWGKGVVKGNNLLLEEFHSPKKIIQLRMAPLVLIGTVITHLFGGSAGREGTAVQMGGAIADQFTKWFKLNERDRRILLSCGVAAGFASVFGTPLAGAIFALEVFTIGRMRYDTIMPSFLSAVFADYGCKMFNIHHTQYEIFSIPNFEIQNFLWVVLVGVFCGLAGMLFSKGVHFWGNLFKKIKYAPLRPFVGGAILALTIWAMGFDTKYIGLGVPTIVDSFTSQMNWYDFLLKILFTTFTLGAGFKGGEVTPLFYVGATLGSALSFWIPLPISLLAGVSFVAVFSGATNTPIACTIMGIELFGAEAAVYIAIACVIAYLFSGHSSIYSAQVVGSPKHWSYEGEKGKTLSQIDSEKH
ncbi:voltage-gated chloride channel family protein [Halosquirtibacter laminarini]|uniref:Voltage-gated chloride channel family protein n=1 Tax=Halosquirtibacter laminarini TaxID=3374600 RepID=A0AC61NQU1_9BACT|nr:voltage-gated chloride channel family protein [Prolixibacteraceae bacterium]